jgi:hypothetical protein
MLPDLNDALNSSPNNLAAIVAFSLEAVSLIPFLNEKIRTAREEKERAPFSEPVHIAPRGGSGGTYPRAPPHPSRTPLPPSERPLEARVAVRKAAAGLRLPSVSSFLPSPSLRSLFFMAVAADPTSRGLIRLAGGQIRTLTPFQGLGATGVKAAAAPVRLVRGGSAVSHGRPVPRPSDLRT